MLHNAPAHLNVRNALNEKWLSKVNMIRFRILEVVIFILIISGLLGCVSESRYLKNEVVDTIVTCEPLPPPVPDAVCYSLPRFRVVSLKQLQKAAQTGLMNDETANAIQNLCGLKTVEGFLIDRKNNDLLILGKVNDTMPPLLLDDFIIALRCAWKKYVVNNMFTPPGCSIDPSPQMLKKINDIETQIFAEKSVSKWKSHQKDFEQACAEPQTVRVLGIPFNSHFASVLVKADYDMKILVDGSDLIDIPGVVDLHALTSYDLRQAMLNKADIEESRSTLSRFWFKPAQISFLEEQNLIALDKCEISLLTEEQHLTGNNKIIDSGRRDPFAEKVATNFTTYYTYIAQKRPLFRQLKELMRIYIVLEAMYNKEAQLKSGINLNYFLTLYRVPEYSVSQTLPGRSRYAIESYQRETINEIQQAAFILPSCGGVAFEVYLEDRHFIKDTDARLAKTSRAIIIQKPGVRALFWDVVNMNASIALNLDSPDFKKL